jgi:NADH-quinone oxidoreductase subunit J
MDAWRFTQDNWPLLAPVVLGFLGVYWLLPRVRQSWAVPGAVAGAAALLGAGWFLIRREVMSVEAGLFYAFSAIAVLGAGLMLAQHNPVRAALSFALVVLSTCGLFLLLAAPFLMAATVIIYAGAIIITFLFVVMLAQQAGLSSADARSREPFLASLAGFILLAGLLVVLGRNYDARKYDQVLAKVQQLVDARTLDDARRILLDPADQKNGEMRLTLVSELSKLLPAEEPTFDNLDGYFHDGKLAELRDTGKKILDILQRARAGQGSLQPDAKLPLSPFSGEPANTPFPTDGKERLPARNVAALGRALFSDYLVAVEMAGVILLVATIGAIVIASRRTGVELVQPARVLKESA